MIERAAYRNEISQKLADNPVVAILGPRQAGKTTLARQIAEGHTSHFFDLEDPTALARLAQPKSALEPLSGLIVIDEIQRKPDLFPLLRVLADRRPLPARFLILGSASPHLVRGVSESLAGRIAFVDLFGFDINEVGANRFRELWWRGGFPLSFLARSDAASAQWRQDF